MRLFGVNIPVSEAGLNDEKCKDACRSKDLLETDSEIGKRSHDDDFLLRQNQEDSGRIFKHEDLEELEVDTGFRLINCTALDVLASKTEAAIHAKPENGSNIIYPNPEDGIGKKMQEKASQSGNGERNGDRDMHYHDQILKHEEEAPSFYSWAEPTCREAFLLPPPPPLHSEPVTIPQHGFQRYVTTRNYDDHVPNITSIISHDVLEQAWLYRDPGGLVRGPFSIRQLKSWATAGLIPIDLGVWKMDQLGDEAVTLKDLLAHIPTEAFASRYLKVWRYEYPEGQTQGPFSLDEIIKWGRLLPYCKKVPIWRNTPEGKDVVYLEEALAGDFLEKLDDKDELSARLKRTAGLKQGLMLDQKQDLILESYENLVNDPKDAESCSLEHRNDLEKEGTCQEEVGKKRRWWNKDSPIHSSSKSTRHWSHQSIDRPSYDKHDTVHGSEHTHKKGDTSSLRCYDMTLDDRIKERRQEGNKSRRSVHGSRTEASEMSEYQTGSRAQQAASAPSERRRRTKCSLPPPQEVQCRYYSKGYCRNGDKCMFGHWR